MARRSFFINGAFRFLRCIAFLLAATLAVAPRAHAACSAAATGNWSAPGTWSGCTGSGGLPGTADIVTIPSARTVTLDIDATVAGLTFAAPGTANALTHSGTSALTVNGPVTFNQPTSNSRTNAWNINAGSATVTGLISFLGTTTTTSRISKIVITSGELNALGGITFTGSASATKQIVMSGGAGVLNLKGALTTPANSCTLTAGTSGSVFNYADGSAAQTVNFFTSGAYDVLEINNTSASGATLGAAVTTSNVASNLLIQSGKLNNGGFAITGGTGDTFQVANGASFEMSGTSGFPTGYSTFTLGATSRVRYLQTTSPLSVPSLTYGHLDLASAGAATQRLPAGAFSILGDLTVGDGTHSTTADLNTNGTVVTVGGSVVINAGSTLTAGNANPLSVAGNWTNSGAFTPNGSTVTFDGAAAQTIDNGGGAFGMISVMNGSSGGLKFSSGFSATQFSADAGTLGGSATVYFSAGSTVTIGALALAGTAANPLVLRSSIDGQPWYLNHAGLAPISYVSARDSNASAGNRILDNPPAQNLGNDVNWAFGLVPPASLAISAVNDTSLSFSWPAPTPAADSYSLQISTRSDFASATTQSTALLSGTTSGLQLDTTYFARVTSVINGNSSSWSPWVSTITLADPPVATATTWADVEITSITVDWANPGNPAGTTYQVNLSPTGDFSSGVLSTTTTGLQATFVALVPAARYYGRVRAINHAGVPTAYLDLASTATASISPPSVFQVTGISTNTVSAAWNASQPAATSYTFQVDDDALFLSPNVNLSTTSLSSVTPAALAADTTYYARVAAVVSGSTSPWTTVVTTATLALAPGLAAPTWTDVEVTSITVAWTSNGNPAGITTYVVQMSTVPSFASGDLFSATTQSLSATITQLDSGATYYARVKAVNHGGTSTAYVSLGSTATTTVPVPKNLSFTAAQTNALSAAWGASVPAASQYQLQVSTDAGFGGTVTSSTSANLSATTASSLLANTTYFGEVRAVIGGVFYPWSAYETTATLAAVPAAAATTWTSIQITSASIAWSGNGNPTGVTRYDVDISTVAGFGTSVLSSTTYATSASFTGLLPGATYFARVRAVNHSGIPTASASLPSATLLPPNAPNGLQATAVQTNALSSAWNDSDPPADSYVFQVDDDPAFGSVNASSATHNLFADTPASLAVNTTYFLRVETVLNGGASGWSPSVATATLANAPATALSTWTSVGQTFATFTWLTNGNPAGTLYVAELSDAPDFVSGTLLSSQTFSSSAGFSGLFTGTPYYARVKAVNWSGIETSYLDLGSTQTVSPNTCNAVATGNWSAATTWSNCTGPGGVPSPSDAVIINSARVVTLDVDATVAGLTFAAPGTSNGLTHSGTASLTVNGPVTFNQPTTSSRNNAWNINAGAATVQGPITFAGTNTTTSRISKIVITTGQLNAFGGITFTGSAAATKQIVMSGAAGQLNLKGNLTVPANSCTLTAGTSGSVFNYADDAAAQTIRFFTSGAYDILTVNNTSAGGATLGAAVTTSNVAANLLVQSGKMNNGGFAITGGSGDTFQVADGAIFEMSAASGFPTGYSTVTLGAASRIRYLQTSTPLTIASQTYGHLDLAAAGTATQLLPAGAVSILGDLTVGDGTHATTADLATNSTTLTVGGSVIVNAAATLTADNASPLSVAGNWTNGGTFVASGSTVAFDGTAAQTIDNRGGAFGYLNLANASAGGVTFSSDFSATGLSINATTLGSAATTYLAAGATASLSSLSVAGDALHRVTLRSTVDGSPWKLVVSSESVAYANVRDSDASGGPLIRADSSCADLGGNVNWDFGPPAAVGDLAAGRGDLAGEVALAWSAPPDAPGSTPLVNADFIVAYTSDTAFASGNGWSPTAALPSDVSRITISTTNVNPGDACAATLSGLLEGTTYHFRLWTEDSAGGFSSLSNGATTYATPLISSVTLSTDVLAFGSLNPGATVVQPVPVVVTNHGNAAATFEVSIDSTPVWQATEGPAGIDSFRLAAIFQNSTPFQADFDTSNDVVSTSTVTASVIALARDGGPDSEKGIDVPPNDSRTLWFRIEMPPISSTVDPQTIHVHVSD